jgi:hypothetical protein
MPAPYEPQPTPPSPPLDDDEAPEELPEEELAPEDPPEEEEAPPLDEPLLDDAAPDEPPLLLPPSPVVWPEFVVPWLPDPHAAARATHARTDAARSLMGIHGTAQAATGRCRYQHLNTAGSASVPP